MSQDELKTKLLSDSTLIGLPIDEVNLFLRPYSVTFYGRYFPSRSEEVTPKVFIYPYQNKCGTFMSYDDIFKTLIHEMVHHIQYCDSSFKRKKGVMHDSNFWKLYNHYINRAEKYELLR